MPHKYLSKEEALVYFDKHPDILAEIKDSLKNRRRIGKEAWRMNAILAAIYCKLDERLIKHLICPLLVLDGILGKEYLLYAQEENGQGQTPLEYLFTVHFQKWCLTDEERIIIAKALLECNDNQNAIKEFPALYLTCSQPQKSKLTRFLINIGADVNKPSNYGETPLCCAAWWLDVQKCRMLIKAGADVNKKGFEKRPLEIAIDEYQTWAQDIGADVEKVQKKCLEIVKMLVKAGADLSNIEELLETAIKQNNTLVIEYLQKLAPNVSTYKEKITSKGKVPFLNTKLKENPKDEEDDFEIEKLEDIIYSRFETPYGKKIVEILNKICSDNYFQFSIFGSLNNEEKQRKMFEYLKDKDENADQIEILRVASDIAQDKI